MGSRDVSNACFMSGPPSHLCMCLAVFINLASVKASGYFDFTLSGTIVLAPLYLILVVCSQFLMSESGRQVVEHQQIANEEAVLTTLLHPQSLAAEHAMNTSMILRGIGLFVPSIVLANIKMDVPLADGVEIPWWLVFIPMELFLVWQASIGANLGLKWFRDARVYIQDGADNL
jgi:hypothetical protein